MDFKMYVVDLDGTLLHSKRRYCPTCARARYTVGSVNKAEVERLNALYASGAVIILHTARGWDLYKETVAQLVKAGVRYHELVMGKPGGAQIDADSMKGVPT